MLTTWGWLAGAEAPLLRGHGGPDGGEGVGLGGGGGRLLAGGGVPARHPRPAPAPAPGVGDQPALAQHAAAAAELMHLLLLEAELVDMPEPEQVRADK